VNRKGYKDFYEVASTKYSPEEGENYYRHDRFFNVRYLVNKRGTNDNMILDVGCGNGYQMEPFTEVNMVYGLDISEANIDKALSRGIKAILHDIEEPFPFEDDFFDIVVCSEVLEHLFFPEKVLQECYRVLKAEGYFIVTVPNLYCFRNRYSILTGRARGNTFIEYPLNQQHIRFFSIDGMKRLLHNDGFEVSYYRGQHFAMNFNWPFKLIWYLHGGNRGLKKLIQFVTFGRITTDIPGLILHFHIYRFLGKLFPKWSPGLIFECRKLRKNTAPT
jgi:methionine biosynthesis protein MetW